MANFDASSTNDDADNSIIAIDNEGGGENANAIGDGGGIGGIGTGGVGGGITNAIVALQFPEGLTVFACIIVDILRKHTGAESTIRDVVGWYYSHPGYGCWLSGIDVNTQSINQQFQLEICLKIDDVLNLCQIDYHLDSSTNAKLQGRGSGETEQKRGTSGEEMREETIAKRGEGREQQRRVDQHTLMLKRSCVPGPSRWAFLWSALSSNCWTEDYFLPVKVEDKFVVDFVKALRRTTRWISWGCVTTAAVGCCCHMWT
ncbi:hypothetical protein niasHS_015750 [Heterodera schachtii]|uniref:JAB1/MPN/MOV34 metalloenzyme domain-containing protein n=1 Tax=Heterodera schachtii TaxID=97005 RepID=A0ABD2HPT7_HETSC